MTARRVVFWRHGQTDFNVAGRIQGTSDIPLNEVGLAQAASAARHLREYEPQVIVASPLIRAQQTAAALGELVGQEVYTDHDLVERHFGLWEGMTGPEIEAQYPEPYRVWSTGGDPEGCEVETRSVVGLRVARAVAEWAERTDGALVVVAHGASLKCGMTTLLGHDASEWSGLRVMSNCHWSVMDIQRLHVPAWRILEYNVGDAGTGEVLTPH